MGSSLSLAVKKKKKKTNEMILPEELVVEILMRLPAKSLMRFKCASKLWFSLISSRYLTNLFLISCSLRQRSFAYFVDKENYALLASSARDHSDTSVSVMDQVLTFPGLQGTFESAVRGLACFTFGNRVRICNIHTRQVVELPVMRSEAIGRKYEMYYFGHDPVRDEYKVLSVVFDTLKKSPEHQVLVLGAGASWRKIQCHIPYAPFWRMMIIKGVLYYEAWSGPAFSSSHVILMSFDFNSEEFKMIELPNTAELFWLSLMNYKGKIAIFRSSSRIIDGTVDVWVLEDAEKSQWSNKKTFVLPLSHMSFVRGDRIMIGGTSHSGKVWLTKVGEKLNLPTLLHLFIYDLERNEIAQRIEIKTLNMPRTLGAIGSSVKTYWSFIDFWDDSESIMYLEI